ncbi:hypothetical protein THOM_1538 [Trachipleistophora hominis]|uniref:Uncharacterized protein n=1 Tax=Trachipleistophora hominis TaxID=72359 RepID=L7JVI6_TRAHO|nr:hypothetical protein THOM_1538 [Trachipleistophora hominis]
MYTIFVGVFNRLCWKDISLMSNAYTTESQGDLQTIFVGDSVKKAYIVHCTSLQRKLLKCFSSEHIYFNVPFFPSFLFVINVYNQ